MLTTLKSPLMGVPREELLQLMGMDDSQWKDASCLQDLLSTLKQQRESDVDAKDVKGRRTGYFYAARSMFRYTFGTTSKPFYDIKRKCLWYLGWKGPKEPEYPERDIRSTYYILQKSHYLYLYMKPQKEPVAKFDMLEPEQRKAFVDIRRSTAKEFPPTQISTPLKHKDLLRVQRLHNGGSKRRMRKELVRGQRRPAPSEDD